MRAFLTVTPVPVQIAPKAVSVPARSGTTFLLWGPLAASAAGARALTMWKESQLQLREQDSLPMDLGPRGIMTGRFTLQPTMVVVF